MPKSIYHLIALLLLLAGPVRTQSWEDQRQAFKNSYQFEANSNLVGAVTALEAVYREDSYELNLRLGWLQYLRGEYPQSANLYRRAIDLMPYAIEAKFGLAMPLAALGNWDEVVGLYQEILRIDPKNSVANYRLGAIYYERKQYEAAFQQVELVVNLYPFDYDSVVLFGWINLQMGRSSKAKALFHKALLIMPEGELATLGLQALK